MTTLSNGEIASAAAPLDAALAALARRFPGDSPARQPVHTVYGGAQLFRSDSTGKLGQVARRALRDHAPDAATLASALGLADAGLAERVYARVVEKLEREPVEDFRIDFEDGYGNRPDAEEDGHAESVAREVAKGLAEGTLPPFLGIRVKTLSEELRGRSVRTLDLFLTTLVEATGGALPPNFVLTLPRAPGRPVGASPIPLDPGDDSISAVDDLGLTQPIQVPRNGAAAVRDAATRGGPS